MNDRTPFHLQYQKGLDGLRGLSILMVLLYHDGMLEWGFGFFGVNTFFVLSGFLITTLLVAEWDQSRTISLRHFYLRRALRLLPALVAMLVAFTIYLIAFLPAGETGHELCGVLWALVYVTNWAHIYSWATSNYLGHTWSLSVEEQFYLVWPLVLLCLLKKQFRRSILCWIFLGVFLCVAERCLLFSGTNLAYENFSRFTAGSDTRADSLLIGCFIGVCLASGLLPQKKWFDTFLKILAPVSLAGILGLAIFFPISPWMLAGGWLLASIFAALLILYLMTVTGPLHRFFENPVLSYIGRLSYGLYLWHVPVLLIMKNQHWPWPGLLGLWPVFAVTLASYYLIEMPFLRLKRRFVRAN